MKTLDGTIVKPTAYGNAVKAWAKDGKKYPLASYLVNNCNCGCTNRNQLKKQISTHTNTLNPL